MRALTFAAASAAACLLAAPALAQQNPAGQWRCQQTYGEYNQQGQRTSGWTREFMIAVYPNGSYEAQGQEASVAGIMQFRSQGQWQYQGGAFVARGQMQDTSGMPGLFGFTAQIEQNGMMRLDYPQHDPSGQWMMNRSMVMCQRG